MIYCYRVMSLIDLILVYLLFCLLLSLRLSMMDLVVAMAPSVDEATMTKTFELIRPYLEVSVHTVCSMASSVFFNPDLSC